jgi:type IV fimbrial biogenesis protein FimT
MIVMHSHGRGYTLIELLIVIAILAMLFGSMPSLTKLVAETRQQSQIAELQHLLELARNSAITSGEITTLCGSNDGAHCDQDWRAPSIMIFTDRDANHQPNAADSIVRSSKLSNEHWHWRGSGNRPYLRFRPDGSVMEWGRFTLCPSSDINYGAQLVLNFAGRPYTTKLNRDQLQAAALCN